MTRESPPHPGPRHCEERARRSNPDSRASHLDCFADARNDPNHSVLTTRLRVRALPSPRQEKIRLRQQRMIPKSGVRFSDKIMRTKKGGGAPIGAPSMSASHDRMLPFDRCAAAALIASRSPFGAPPRHSPGRTHPPLAQLQFPRFLRPDLAGVTRFNLSRVYRAPQRPVVVPAERWPRAARERSAYPPPAGTAPAPSSESALAKGVPR